MPRIRQLTKREKILAGLVGLVMVFSFYKYVYAPQAAERIKLDQEIASLQATIDRYKSLKAALQARAPASQPSPVVVSALETAVKESTTFTNIFKNLTIENEREIFHLKRLAVEKQEQEKDYKKTYIDFEIEGPFLEIGGFLANLEKSALLASIHSIDITRIDTDLRQCIAKLKIQTYLFPEEP